MYLVGLCVCVYICIYIYIHTYIYTLSVYADVARDRHLAHYFLPPRLSGAVRHNFLTKRPSGAVVRFVSADYDPFMLHAWGAAPYFLLAVRAFLHNSVFPDEMACSLPWFESVPFICLVTSEVYCLCATDVSDVQDFETTNWEWILGDSYEAWNFPAGQAITVQTQNVLRWRSRWALSIFVYRQKATLEKACLCS